MNNISHRLHRPFDRARAAVRRIRGAAQPAPLSAPKYHQFDYFLGRWTVTQSRRAK